MKFGAQLGILVAVSLAGCASVPLQLKGEPITHAPSTSSAVASRLPTDAEKYSSTGLKDTYFGVSGAKGSAAVGVLFGVIGVLGNVAHINSENKDSASPLGELTSQDLAKTLNAEITTDGSNSGGLNAAYELVPSASLYFQDKNAYWLACTITARQKATSWHARYTVTVESQFNSASKPDTENAINSLAPCLKSAYHLFADHVDDRLGKFATKTIVSPRLDGKGDSYDKFSVATSALPGRVITNDVLGLVQLRKDQIKAIN